MVVILEFPNIINNLCNFLARKNKKTVCIKEVIGSEWDIDQATGEFKPPDESKKPNKKEPTQFFKDVMCSLQNYGISIIVESPTKYWEHVEKKYGDWKQSENQVSSDGIFITDLTCDKSALSEIKPDFEEVSESLDTSNSDNNSNSNSYIERDSSNAGYLQKLMNLFGF